MKAILEFDLADPNDRTAHLRCIKSTDMAIALFDIIYNLSNAVKNRENENSDILCFVCEQITEWTKNLNIDELIQ